MRIPKPSLENLGHKTYFRESNGSNSNSKLFQLNPVLGLSQLFAIPSFDKETERQFWEERYLVLLTPLKWALCYSERSSVREASGGSVRVSL